MPPTNQRKIKVRVSYFPETAEKKAIVMREVHYDHKAVKWEVLAQNGKWREKTENSIIFEDEKFPVEEV